MLLQTRFLLPRCCFHDPPLLLLPDLRDPTDPDLFDLPERLEPTELDRRDPWLPFLDPDLDRGLDILWLAGTA